MSIVGGAGMLATGIAQPIVGGWLDAAKNEATSRGLTGEAAEPERCGLSEDLHARAIIADCVIVCFAKPRASRNLPAWGGDLRHSDAGRGDHAFNHHTG